MIGLHPDCPPSVTLLADHLDAALAVGEDLLASSLPPRSDLDDVDPQGAPDALDEWVRRLMQLEGSLLLRVLQARRLANDCPRDDAAMKAAVALFKSQTEALHELILRAGREENGLLARAGDAHAYFRSRGLIAPEAAAPSPFERLVVCEAFRIGGVAPLGLMLDMVSALLDLLDARYGLYSPELADESPATALAAADNAGVPVAAVEGHETGDEPVVASAEEIAGADLASGQELPVTAGEAASSDEIEECATAAEDAVIEAAAPVRDAELAVAAGSKAAPPTEGIAQPAV